MQNARTVGGSNWQILQDIWYSKSNNTIQSDIVTWK